MWIRLKTLYDAIVGVGRGARLVFSRIPILSSAKARITALYLFVTALPGVPVIGFLADVQALTDPACQTAWMRGSLCKVFGVGGVATAKEQADYDKALAEGCDGLRLYINRADDNDPLLPRAERYVAAKRLVAEPDQWTPSERELSIFVDSPWRPTAKEATEAANGDAQRKADVACKPYMHAAASRLISTAPVWVPPPCETENGEWRCSGALQVRCQIEVRSEKRYREQCGPA